MKQTYYKQMNAELAGEIHLFSMEHGEWMADKIPPGAIVVMQTDDPDFNRWAIAVQKRNTAGRKPKPPVVLVHIRKLRPRKSRIVEAEARLLATGKLK
jgi:hypothetical protein